MFMTFYKMFVKISFSKIMYVCLYKFYKLQKFVLKLIHSAVHLHLKISLWDNNHLF